MRGPSPAAIHARTSLGRFLLISFPIGAVGLAIARFGLGDLVFPFNRSPGDIALSALAGGPTIAGRAQWAAMRHPSGEDAQSWRRHDVVLQAKIAVLTLLLIALGLAIGHVMGQPRS